MLYSECGSVDVETSTFSETTLLKDVTIKHALPADDSLFKLVYMLSTVRVVTPFYALFFSRICAARCAGCEARGPGAGFA